MPSWSWYAHLLGVAGTSHSASMCSDRSVVEVLVTSSGWTGGPALPWLAARIPSGFKREPWRFLWHPCPGWSSLLYNMHFKFLLPGPGLPGRLGPGPGRRRHWPVIRAQVLRVRVEQPEWNYHDYSDIAPRSRRQSRCFAAPGAAALRRRRSPPRQLAGGISTSRVSSSLKSARPPVRSNLLPRTISLRLTPVTRDSGPGPFQAWATVGRSRSRSPLRLSEPEAW